MNYDENRLKTEMDMMNNMSDEQIRSMAQMKGMNIDPAMLRQSAAMMKNMSPEAQKNMFEMAQKMHASGQMPNIPGMTPSFSPTYSAPSPKLQGPPLSSELESIRVLKDCGNVKFKDKLYDEAEKLYNDAILKLEDARLGIDPSQKSNLASLEASILLNLSNIKWANKDYTSLLNISKEVVRINPESGKGYFRYGQALFHLGKAEAALDKLKLAEKYTSSDEKFKKEVLAKLGRTESDQNEKEEKSKPASTSGRKNEDESEIMEDKPVAAMPQRTTAPAMPTFPGGIPNIPPGQMPDINSIDDSQLNMMKSMMETESGRKMMRDMMKSQMGMDMSDEQLAMMSGFMNKDMLKMASQMKNSGGSAGAGMPNFPSASSGTVAGGPQSAPSMPMGGGNMDEMMKNMADGKQPGVDDLMKNKDMIKMMIGMMKSNPAMIRSMSAQLGESHPVSKYIKGKSDEELKKLATWLERGVSAMMACYPAFKFIKDNIRVVMLFVAAYFVYKYIL